jgi:hypothetical protein
VLETGLLSLEGGGALNPLSLPLSTRRRSESRAGCALGWDGSFMARDRSAWCCPTATQTDAQSFKLLRSPWRWRHTWILLGLFAVLIWVITPQVMNEWQPHWTYRIGGVDYGVEQIKSRSFLVCGGHRVTVAAGVAAAVVSAVVTCFLAGVLLWVGALRTLATRWMKRTSAEPDGPAPNGSQPIRSETNPTSSAAGSRR